MGARGNTEIFPKEISLTTVYCVMSGLVTQRNWKLIYNVILSNVQVKSEQQLLLFQF